LYRRRPRTTGVVVRQQRFVSKKGKKKKNDCSMVSGSLLLLLCLWGFFLASFASAFVFQGTIPAEGRTKLSTTIERTRQQRRPTALSAHRWGSNSNDHHHNSRKQQQQQQSTKVPFLIETLPRYTSHLVFPEIADMCIQAFFNDDDDGDDDKNKNKNMPPWKAVQLSFLRRLQTADLERRRRRQADHNAMLVARRVLPADDILETNQQQRDSPLLLNLDGIIHRELLQGAEDVVRGEILGFVEVTLKPYGLAGGPADAYAHESAHDNDVYEIMDDDTSYNALSANDDVMNNGYADDVTFTPTPWWGKSNNGQSSRAPVTPPPLPAPDRPVLTNLSVRKSARGAGVGGALMAAAEETVRYDWQRNEMVLEVEDDNHNALAFYQKRGYDILFADKTARRYDVSGLWLQQKRCTRLVLRKDLAATSPQHEKYITKPISSVLQKLRDTYRSVVEAR
jgi:ribosomal protein S18 acetylase RimI-like enzyme